MEMISIFQPKRDNKGRFAKGHSGNPGGIPREIHQALRLARSRSGQAIQVAYNILMDKDEAARDRLKACEIVLERGLGKAPQLNYSINVDEGSEESKAEVAILARQALAAINSGDVAEGECIEMEEVPETPKVEANEE